MECASCVSSLGTLGGDFRETWKPGLFGTEREAFPDFQGGQSLRPSGKCNFSKPSDEFFIIFLPFQSLSILLESWAIEAGRNPMDRSARTFILQLRELHLGKVTQGHTAD